MPTTNNNTLIRIETNSMGIELNTKHGLDIQRLWLNNEPNKAILGRIPLGYFEDIRIGSEFHSGHVVFQQPGHLLNNDLIPCVANLSETEGFKRVHTQLRMPLGPMEKEYRIYNATNRVDLICRLNWTSYPHGLLRLGHITLLPDAFDAGSLWYATHNGGPALEKFYLDGPDFNQRRPVSFGVSATTAVGMTENIMLIGDNKYHLKIGIKREDLAVVPMIIWQKHSESFLMQVNFSAGELDDTRHGKTAEKSNQPLIFHMSLEISTMDMTEK
ncbi:MAG: hypothetical protein V4534_02170 [Myxococcota bacterium]